MGGDSYCFSYLSSEDVSSSGEEVLHSSGDEGGVRHKLGTSPPINGEFSDVDEPAQRQRFKAYTEVLRTYEDLQPRIDRLDEAKSKILSYTPGSWTDKADFREHDRPNATSILLIGPKGSGKSSLVNKISCLLEDSTFLPARAQVSYNSVSGDGTYFLHEHTIPRGSRSFCLYDTRCLSVDSSENLTMIKQWMTRGVCHGQLISRKSDSMALKARLKGKGRRRFFCSRVRPVDFVIFVVSGLSVLEALNNADGKKEYSETIAANFNNPLLSFKDDKPAIAVTHGDLLSLSDRVRVRVYLGELLGVPPAGQIFDIPENNDPASTLAVFDMLIFCLERADRNLPAKNMFRNKIRAVRCLQILAVQCLLLCIIASMVVFFGLLGRASPPPRFTFRVACN